MRCAANEGLSSALFDVRVRAASPPPQAVRYATASRATSMALFADAYGVLQESSPPRADEHAIWDTLRSRKPGSVRAMPSQFETSYAI